MTRLIVVLARLSVAACMATFVFVAARQCSAQQPEGLIAYIRSGKTPGDEIRLIKPDGTEDRPLWKLQGIALTGAVTGITGLSWRPDGKELAFSSDHDSARSYYESNIYAIGTDGTGLRRLTDAPAPSEFNKYPKGRVAVTIRNHLADTSQFIVYVTGAPVAQSVIVPAPASKTITFDDVADFGPLPHAVVAMLGKTRWTLPGPVVRVGQTVNAGTLDITANGYEHLGYTIPTWRSDGKEIACVLGGGAALEKVAANPSPGTVAASSMIGGKQSIPITTYDLGPTAATFDQILYANGLTDFSIHRTKEGSGEPGEAVVDYHSTEYVVNIMWLPDASGFLYSINDFFGVNLFRYDFASKKTTQVTHFEGEGLYSFAPSPDGQWVVFDRKKLKDTTSDVWLMRIDGSGMRLLVKNAAAPVWGRTAKPSSKESGDTRR